MQTCRACGEVLPDDARFCGCCGFRIGPLPVTRIRGVVTLDPEPAIVTERELAIAETVRIAVDAFHRAAQSAPSGRQFPRYPMRIDVNFHSDHNFFTGAAENVSEGGLFVATPNPLAVGHQVVLTFSLPGLDEAFTIPCEVRWIRKPGEVPGSPAGMGLRFLHLTAEVIDAIEAFVGHREPILSEV